MLKLNNKNNGFTIIEVVCSFTVFTIIFLLAMTIKLCTIKLELYNNELEKYNTYAKDIKTEILDNISNDDINKLIADGNVYIPSEEINDISLKQNNIINLFEGHEPTKMPYVELKVLDKDNIYLEKINVILYAKIQGKNQEINTEFFKGNYKWKRDLH